MERYSELFRYIEENKGKYVDLVSQLISHPSVSAYSSGLRECADVVAELMDGAGLRARVFDNEYGPPIVFGEINAEAHATLMFYNHYDVQPAEPLEKWNTPPFAPTVLNNCLYGRGAADNKGNIAARLAALDAVLNVLGELPVNVKMIVEGGEEVGSPGLEEFVKREKDLLFADACIWEYGYRNMKEAPVINLGVKGMLYVELEARGLDGEIHSSWGAVVENPAWRLVKALNTLRTDDGIVQLENFYDNIDYSGQELLNGLTLDDITLPEGAKLAFYGEPLKRLLLEPALNITGLYSGYIGPGSKTIIPSNALAKLDFRLVPKQDPKKIHSSLVSHLQKHGFDDINVQAIQMYPAARTDPDSFIVRLVADTARSAYGVEPVVIPSGAASGPMYVITEILEIPCVSTGVGYYGSSPHGPNEHIRLKDFIAGIKHLALVMVEFHRYMHIHG